MDFLEKNLEEIIFFASQSEDGRKKLSERGLDINGRMFRQVDLGSYGRIDLLSVELCRSKHSGLWILYLEVYELKRNIINTSALIQGCRYLTGIKELIRYLRGKFKDFDDKIFLETSLILIGDSFDSQSDFSFLYNELHDNIQVYTFKYDLDGITFEYVDKLWIQTEPKFNEDIVEAFSKPSKSMLRSLMNIEHF